MRGVTIAYAALYLDPQAESGIDSGELRVVGGVRDPSLFHSAVRLARMVSNDGGGDGLACEALAASIRRHVFTSYSPGLRSPNGRPIPPLTSEQVRLAREYIHDTLSSAITLDDLSSLLDLTTHDLLIAFRTAFGTTPAQYVISQRVRAAQRLLLHSSDDITCIALKTGFSSHSHLTCVFRQRVGCPPSEFRRQHGK